MFSVICGDAIDKEFAATPRYATDNVQASDTPALRCYPIAGDVHEPVGAHVGQQTVLSQVYSTRLDKASKYYNRMDDTPAYILAIGRSLPWSYTGAKASLSVWLSASHD